MHLFVTIILDGVGIGEQPDSATYGDEGSDTLGHVCEASHPHLPNLAGLGLGRIRPLTGIDASTTPEASWGRMLELSPGKDSTTGHWELAGIKLNKPFPTYPDGFSSEVISKFVGLTGSGSILGNKAASGTAIIAELGDEHVRTGFPIVYTSADSVFQIATHVDLVPIERLYEMCRMARAEICIGDHGVGRVIARPFHGASGSYIRISSKRKDFSRLPTSRTLQESLQKKGVQTISIGKIYDLFCGVGFDESHETTSNADGIKVLVGRIREAAEAGDPAFLWINLVEFDQEFGHLNDPDGFAGALEEFDTALPHILGALPDGARMVITSDHGNDPTTASTDHSREYVPLLYCGSGVAEDLGTRSSFSDHAATVAAYFGAPFETGSLSFETF